MRFHPLGGLHTRIGDGLVRIKALCEAVVAAARQALDKGGSRVAGSLEDLGQGLGLVGHIVARRSEPIGGWVKTAEEGGQRRLRLRRLGEGPLEAHRLCGQCVERGSPGRGTIAAESIRTYAVERNDYDRMSAGYDTALLALFTSAGHQHHDREAAHCDSGHEAFQEALLFHTCNTLPGPVILARGRGRAAANSEF